MTLGPKPNLSFVAMITQAIENSPNRMCRLSEIYKFISTHYPYFKMSDRKWQNSIRHSLSFNDCFVRSSHKLVQEDKENRGGRGDYWQLHQKAGHMFNKGGLLRRHKKFVDQGKQRPMRSMSMLNPSSYDNKSYNSSNDQPEEYSTMLQYPITSYDNYNPSLSTYDTVSYVSSIDQNDKENFQPTQNVENMPPMYYNPNPMPYDDYSYYPNQFYPNQFYSTNCYNSYDNYLPLNQDLDIEQDLLTSNLFNFYDRLQSNYEFPHDELPPLP